MAEINPNVPLECQGIGEFDGEQLAILACTGSADLVLIENAADVIRDVLMERDKPEPVIFERMLDAISKSAKCGCVAIRSQTFPLWMRHPERLTREDHEPGAWAEYMELMAAYRNDVVKALAKKPKPKCLITINAVELHSAGHYASFYYDVETDSVRVFDSMQSHPETGSAYTPFFFQLAEDAFGTTNVSMTEHLGFEESPQITGGFSGLIPLMALENYDVWQTMSQFEQWLHQITSTESQNHFCYMWAIWSLHVRVAIKDSTLEDVIMRMMSTGIEPLIVIKRYIWGIFTCPQFKWLYDEIPMDRLDFVEKNWDSFWGSDKRRYELVFNNKVCKFLTPRATSIRNALDVSLNTSVDVSAIPPSRIPAACLRGIEKKLAKIRQLRDENFGTEGEMDKAIEKIVRLL
jgi:hypothetical protein